MKALIIGGTGTISTAVVQRLSEDPLWDVWTLNRGNRKMNHSEHVHQIIADINDEDDVAAKIDGMFFDAWCDQVISSLETAKERIR